MNKVESQQTKAQDAQTGGSPATASTHGLRKRLLAWGNRILASDYRLLLLLVPCVLMWLVELIAASDYPQTGFVADFAPETAFIQILKDAGRSGVVTQITQATGGEDREAWRIVRFTVKLQGPALDPEVLEPEVLEQFEQDIHFALLGYGAMTRQSYTPGISSQAGSFGVAYRRVVSRGIVYVDVIHSGEGRYVVTYQVTEFPY